MPIASPVHGFRCPRPDCTGFCGVDETRPDPHKSMDRRHRYCRECGHEFDTVEVALPASVPWLITQLRIELRTLDGGLYCEDRDAVRDALRRLVLLSEVLGREQGIEAFTGGV